MIVVGVVDGFVGGDEVEALRGFVDFNFDAHMMLPFWSGFVEGWGGNKAVVSLLPVSSLGRVSLPQSRRGIICTILPPNSLPLVCLLRFTPSNP